MRIRNIAKRFSIFVNFGKLVKHPDTVNKWVEASSDYYYDNEEKAISFQNISWSEVQATIEEYTHENFDFRHRWQDGWLDTVIDAPRFSVYGMNEDGEHIGGFINMLPRWMFETPNGKVLIGWEIYIKDFYEIFDENTPIPKSMILGWDYRD